MEENILHQREDSSDSTVPAGQINEARPAAWEMIENGRYQPRRIKGSCLGRELG